MSIESNRFSLQPFLAKGADGNLTDSLKINWQFDFQDDANFIYLYCGWNTTDAVKKAIIMMKYL